MNLLPEVIVMIMSVVVLSLVRLRSFPSFVSFRGGSQIVGTENVKERVISLSLSLRGERKREMKEGRIRADG